MGIDPPVVAEGPRFVGAIRVVRTCLPVGRVIGVGGGFTPGVDNGSVIADLVVSVLSGVVELAGTIILHHLPEPMVVHGGGLVFVVIVLGYYAVLVRLLGLAATGPSGSLGLLSVAHPYFSIVTYFSSAFCATNR